MMKPFELEGVIATHQLMVWRYLFALTSDGALADDLAQEVFVEAWRKPPQERDDRAVAAYLRKIARTCFAGHMRKTRPATSLDGWIESGNDLPSDPGAEDDPRVEPLKECLEALPERTKRALALKFDDDRPNEDIAKQLNTTLDAVKSLFKRANQQLFNCINRRMSHAQQEERDVPMSAFDEGLIVGGIIRHFKGPMNLRDKVMARIAEIQNETSEAGGSLPYKPPVVPQPVSDPVPEREILRWWKRWTFIAEAAAVILVLAGIVWVLFNWPTEEDKQPANSAPEHVEPQAPPNTLEDDNFKLEFDHTKGGITTIIWKKHAPDDLLSDEWNERNNNGFTRVACSERNFNESISKDTTVRSWTGGASDFTITYDNPGYGSKTLHVTWTADKLTVQLDLRLTQKGNHHVGGFLKPFADHGSGRVGNAESKFNFTYPGPSTMLFGGSKADAVYAASKDGTLAIGILSPIQRTLTMGNGDVLDGPMAYFTESGSMTFELAAEEQVRLDLGLTR